ncbi:carbohydrate kinase family protein [Urechidicola croceus]|uniref:Carbohydrate kinase n=1 Tax=Urechidicola croceus TaxID=1850246 RepID=A0A1D8P585_9FLAO|nr:carbohydrate kinase [Urechidicola croceus]AOW19735.1 carbohydrate kinase [Urechidicola croceus]
MNPTAICFGEILWDVFPDGRKIGGAPLNVALKLQNFNITTSIISRIGDDLNGEIILDYIQEHQISTDYIQIDSKYKTGEVIVFLNNDGGATYNITYPVAWDKIELTSALRKIVVDADIFIFGSLASRDVQSKNTLINLLNNANFKVYDVNLRKPHYTLEGVLEFMILADFIKFNDEEIEEICILLNLKTASLEEQIMEVASYTNTTQICVTLGCKGAVLFIENNFYYNNGFTVNVVDTVGSGDSFLAGLISQLFLKKAPQQSLDYGCAVGAIVASKKGANPEILDFEINSILKQ